jgi:hypothetical protein
VLAGLVVQEESKVITDKLVMLATQEPMELVDLVEHAEMQGIQETLVMQETQEIMAHVETAATEVTVAAAVPMVDLLAVQDQVEPEAVILELVVAVDPVQGVDQVVLEVEDKLVTQEQLVETAQPELLELLEVEQTQDKAVYQEGTVPTARQERLAQQEQVLSLE